MGRETLFLPAPQPSTATARVNPMPPPPPPVPRAATPNSLAPGFRFHPTDEELVIYYLKRKVASKNFRYDVISEVDIYRSEPWDLAGKSKLKTRDQEWYFFSALDKKYGNGGRMNRATSKGYWKATGNDRPVKHEQRDVGLKKTLVFHSGRAPDGKRTNWVMHEYRLVEEELQRATGSSQPQDAYVLCRVFHKNNIGPPNGQRYAPFIEEEWDDDTVMMVPGLEPVYNDYIAHEPRVEGNGGVSCAEKRNDVVQDTQSINRAPFDVNKLPIETQNLLAVCKRESMAEYPSPEKDDNNCKPMDEHPSPQTDNPKPFSQYKRRRHNSNPNNSNVSGDSIRTSQGPCSSTITTAATTLPATTTATASANTAPKKHFLSALVEFSLLESLESKESLTQIQAPDMNTEEKNSAKFNEHLKSEMQKLTIEKEAMRFEVTSAQAMINILQSRIDALTKENEDLKRKAQNP